MKRQLLNGFPIVFAVLLFCALTFSAVAALAVEMSSVGVVRDRESGENFAFAATADGVLLRHGTSWGFECLGDWQTPDLVDVAVYYDTIRRVSGTYAAASDGAIYRFEDEAGFTEAAAALGPVGLSSAAAFYYPGIVDISTYYNPTAKAAVVYAVTEDGSLFKYDTSSGYALQDNFGAPGIVTIATHFDLDYYRSTVYGATDQGDLYRYTTSAGMEGLIGNFGASERIVDLTTYLTPASVSVVYALAANGEILRWDSAGGFEQIGSFGEIEAASIAACFHPQFGQDAVYAVSRPGDLYRYSDASGTFSTVGNFGASAGIVHLSMVPLPFQPLEVVYALDDSGKLYTFTPSGGFSYIVDYHHDALYSLASYHNPALDPPLTVIYSCTGKGGLYKYDTTDGLDGLMGYFGPNLDATLVYTCTESGNLFRYSSSSGDYGFVGNFGASEDIVDISGYYNARLPVTVIYAITGNGRMYKYDTLDGFEPSADFATGGIVSVASYLKYVGTTRQAVVYAASESGDLYRFTTSGGPEGPVGAFPATASVRDMSAYHDPAESFGLLYAVTASGELLSYSLADGFELTGVFPEPDCQTGTGIVSVSYPVELEQNYPNPFNPTTTISFTTGTYGPATVRVYDVEGRLVRVLWNAETAPGTRVVTWDGTDERGEPVASGVYLCRLSAGDQQAARKMMLLK